MATFEDFLNERNITLKRRYTEAHPAKTVGNSAKVRNAIIEALKDGKITVEEFNNIVSQHSSAPSKWTRGNKRFFKIEEDGVSLSKYGTKILNSLVTESVNENYEVIFSDGIAQMQKFRREEQAIDFMKKTIASNKKLRDIAVYKPGMHSTTQTEYVVAFWGDGSYLDNVSKKNTKLAKKKVTESVVTEGTYDSKDHIGSTSDGQGSNAEIYKKGRGYYVVVSGQHDYDFEAKNDKELINKLEEYEFDSSDILESIDEGLNKSDVAYQLAIDYTGRTKPKITKLNKKRLEIKYGYKISPETVIDSIKKVHPEVELKHVEWSDKMSGGGFHIFDILESVVTESEAENILQDLLDERGGDMGELHGMKMEDALDTVKAYGHKGSKAKKIAQELFSMCNESVVNEAKSEEVEIDIDFAGSKADLKRLSKKYNIEADQYNPGQVMLKGDKKDILAYLRSPQYGMDIRDIKDLFPELLESAVTEARYDKKKLLKKLGDADDAMIQTGDGKEYIIYNPDSNNDDNAAMWHDKSVFAVDQDGDEYEISYKDITSVMTESVNEARVSAKKLLKSVVNGETNSVEGIKLSKGMAQAFSDWLENSTYGRKFSKLPFDKLFTAAFNWGIERYAKSGELKGELKDLKTKAKEMKESKIHENFSEFINESFTSKLTGIARRAKNVKDFINQVFKHEKFKAFDTPKTQPDSYENFLNFIKGHYEMVQQYESNKIKENMIYTNFKQFVNEALEVNEAKDPYKEIKKAIKSMKGVSAEIKGDEIRVSNNAGDEFTYSMLDNDDVKEFISSIKESVELNEALKSSKLRGLLTMKRGSKQILKAIYGFSKIELDKITDDQIMDIDPKLGKKAEGLVVYYTTQEKENPYADTSKSSYNNSGRIPANTILALGMGKDVAYIKRDYIKRKMTMSLTLNPKKSSSDIGINKDYRGWDASGIYNVKRVIDVADAAFVINTNALPNAKGKIEDRIKAKEGALAFKSDKEFKDANIARYREILQKRASELPIDKLVEDAIDDATKVMKDGLKKQEKNKYGELIAGVGADGRAYKLNDISNFINGLISDYERWSGYMATIEEAEAKYGKDSKEFEWEARYSQKESEEYAKRIKDKLAKLKKRNLAW